MQNGSLRSGMKVTNVITTKQGNKKIEIVLDKETELHLLQFAFRELMERGAINIKQERDKYLLDIPAQGNG